MMMTRLGRPFSVGGWRRMGALWLLLWLKLAAMAVPLASPVPFVEGPRLAVLPLGGDRNGEVATMLQRTIEEERQRSIELIDSGLTALARRGSPYAESLNLTLEEARGLGQTLGADYYVMGRIWETPRQTAAGRPVFVALAGLYLVESRRGRLLRFELLEVTGEDEGQAHQRLLARVPEGWASLLTALTTAESAGEGPPPRDDGGLVEVFTDEPLARNAGVALPVFERQLKPDYPEMAARAEMVATVEVTALFRADGMVDEVELSRWAGFGLDEAAVATVCRLRFRPAIREGRPVSFRGLVRYNFRRPTPQAIQHSIRSREELDRLRQSLRDLLKTRPVP
jgi:TonB family protein